MKLTAIPARLAIAVSALFVLASGATAAPLLKQTTTGGSLIDDAKLVPELPPQNAVGSASVNRSFSINSSLYVNGISSGCCDEGEGDGRGPLTNDNGTNHKILLHSGQEVLTEVDLVVPGRDPGSTLVFQRRHTTRRDNPDSVLGPAWAFSLHQSVKPHPSAGTAGLPTGSLLLEGFGRSDALVYKGISADGQSHRYEGGSGRFLTGLYKPGNPNASPPVPPVLELWLRGGAMQLFEGVMEVNPGGTFLGIEGNMTGTMSPAGNRIQFTLNGAGHVEQVMDSFGRIFELVYDSTPRLTTIRELTGTLGGATPSVRLAVDYAYHGGSGNLAEVKLPNVTPAAVTTVTPFSGRPTITYEYVAPLQYTGQPWLDNALVSATYPNQNVGSTPGPTRLEWIYCDSSDPTCEGFVLQHKVGAASYAYQYSAGSELLAVGSAAFAGGVNDEAIQTIVTDKNGTETVFQMNRYGQVLLEQILSPTPKARPSDPIAWARQYEYNDDQLITIETMPGGMSRNVQYPPPTVGRRSQGNAQVVVILPEANAPDPTGLGALATKKLYEPIFNHVLAVVDPRGLSATPTTSVALTPTELEYTTWFSYDYMSDYANAYLAFYERLNLTFDLAGLTAFIQLLEDSGVDTTAPVPNPAPDYQPCGQVTRIDYPEVKPLDLTSPVLAEGSAQLAVEVFEYNKFGQRVAHTDPEGLVTHWEYFGAGDPADQGAFGDPSMAAETTGGFLKKVVVDVGGIEATTQFQYANGGGNHAIPSLITAPNGTGTVIGSNLADQITSSVTVVGAVATGFRRAYDANGNLHVDEVLDHDPVDPTSTAADFVAHVYEYSLLDQLIIERINFGNPDEIRNEYVYNGDELLSSATFAVGEAEETVTSYTYDARNLIVSVESGAIGGAQAETRYLVDGLGNVTAIIDADDHPDSPQHPLVGAVAGWEGDYIENIYDGWGRLVETRDRVGTRTKVDLDRAGLVEEVRVYGTVEDFVLTETLLSRSACFYDERARPIVCGTKLFYYRDASGAGYSHTAGDPGAVDYPAGGLVGDWVYNATAYNMRSQVVGTVDADGDVTVVGYDSAARVQEVTDAVGSKVQYGYDVSGNVESVDADERSANLAISDLFHSEATYDGLNRLKTIKAPNDEITEYFYDARGRVTRVRDALANDTEYRYDAFGRQTHELRFLSSIPTTGLSGAVGANASNVDVGQGGGDGVITLVREYDSLHRLIKQTDDGALDTASASPTSTPRATEYVYVALSRMTAINYANGESESWTYNADGELETHVSQQGVTCHFDVDPRGRTRFMRFEGPYSDPAVDSTVGIPGLFGPGPGGTNFNRRFAWDGLDRLWGQCDHNGGTVWDDVYIDHWLDSLGRKITEKQRIDTAPYNGANHVEIAQMHYSGASRMTSLRYPKNATESARTLTYTHDALDRVATISDGTGPIASYDYVGAGRLARLEYFYDSTSGAGAVLDLRNGTGDATNEESSVGAQDAGYDANGRPVNWRWMANNGSSPSLITGYQSSYNGPAGVGTGRRDGEVREHFGLEDTYRHDSQYRMTEFVRDYASVAAPGVTTAASLDGVDKFTALVEGTTDLMPEVDSASSELNQYSSFAGGARVYDKLGNLLEDGSGKYFQYGPDGRLVTVWTARPSNGGTKIVSYVYDAIGRRIVEQDNVTGIAKQLVYAGGWQVVEEKNLRHTGDPYRQFVTGPRMDEHLQMRVFDGQGGHEDYWYHCNSQGFVGAITNDSEDVEEYYTYSMLGQPTVFTPNSGGSGVTAQGAVSTIENPYSFQGRRYDDETGWFHFRHRQYDPLSGEFTTVDPSGMWRHGQGAGYSALDCDMWGRTDPLGLDTILGDFLWSITPPIVDDLVKGVVDTAYGVGETAVGVIAAPFDGGELISSGIDEIVDGLGATVGGVGDAASLAWQSPQAVAGVGWIAIGVVSWCLGAGEAPDIAAKAWEGGMGFEYANHPLMGGGAMSLGPFTFYESGSKAWAGPEEHAHQLQSLWMGPLYLPGHLVGGGVSLCLSTFWPDGGLRGGQSDWHRYNPLEYGPGLSPPVPFF